VAVTYLRNCLVIHYRWCGRIWCCFSAKGATANSRRVVRPQTLEVGVTTKTTGEDYPVSVSGCFVRRTPSLRIVGMCCLDDSRLRSLKRSKDRSGRLRTPSEHGNTTTLAIDSDSVEGILRVVWLVTCRKPSIDCEDSDQNL
jgi:hypothetical protein